MRIELQLGEFERGDNLPVPVAAAACGAMLVNQLMVNQFAINRQGGTGPRRWTPKSLVQSRRFHRLGQNDAWRGILRREIVVVETQTTPLPVLFVSPVEFKVPIR